MIHYRDMTIWELEQRIKAMREELHKRGVSAPQYVGGDEKPVAWLIERPRGTGKEQTVEREVVLSPLTDATLMDEGDAAWPLYGRPIDSGGES